MHVNEFQSLYHIEPTSILITQLGAESETRFLRERVLRDTVAEQDELIHCERRRGCEVGSLYIYIYIYE
jgi:hypothetical protein